MGPYGFLSLCGEFSESGHDSAVWHRTGRTVRRSTTPPPTPGTSMIAQTPVVLAVLVIDVPHGFGDIACRRHGVGLVVSAVDPYPSAFAAHDHGLVFTEACDVGSDDWAASALEGSLLCCLNSLGQDQRVIGDVGELAEDLRLVGALVTPQRTLRSSTGETSSGSSRFWDPFTRVRRGVEGKTVITCQPDPACRSARSVIMIIRVTNRQHERLSWWSRHRRHRRSTSGRHRVRLRISGFSAWMP